MNLRITILVAFSVCFFNLSAQNWGGEGARWTYDYSNFAYLGFSEITFEKDTTINDRNVQKFHRRLKYQHLLLGNIEEFQLEPILMYESQGIVFLLNGNQFDTLYNFNAEAGEKWRIKWISADEELVTEVMEVGFKEINGQLLKWQLVNHSYLNDPQYGYQDTLVERIGSIWHYLLPWDYFASQSDMNQGGFFRCFESISLGTYRNPGFDLPCNFVTSSNELSNKYNIQVSPNPFDDVIKLTMDNGIPKGSEVLIQTVTGYTLEQLRLAPNAEYVDIRLSKLPQGIYFLNIIKSGEILYTAKIVKI